MNNHPAPPSWREAARAAMYEATLAELRGRHNTTDVSFNYRWEHVTTVVTLALRLAELTGADAETVEAAAWLHDVCKFSHGERHAIAGAAFARDFLPTTDFPTGKIDAVAHAIDEHMGLWRETPLTVLESQVLWDADKLAKIGLTAVFHWTGGSLAGQRMHTLAQLIRRAQGNDWLPRTVESMQTAPARRAARARLEAYNNLYATLQNELSGADLA